MSRSKVRSNNVLFYFAAFAFLLFLAGVLEGGVRFVPFLGALEALLLLLALIAFSEAPL